MEYIRFFHSLRSKDVGIAGGKNASLGEMIYHLKKRGIRVPDGFATTASSYWDFIHTNFLKEKIQNELSILKKEPKKLQMVGKKIRQMILQGKFSPKMEKALLEAYRKLSEEYKTKNVDVAVRSSATAEDLPEASFAGQQESFLHITSEKALLDACKRCYASLFTDRAIAYRHEKGFDHMKVALSIGVQKMVRSDKAGSGVIFTLDTETGFRKVIIITAAFGLGENVVQGEVQPDEYIVFKPLLGKSCIPILEKNIGSKEKKLIYTTKGTTKNIPISIPEQNSLVLNDKEILQLAKWAAMIENHFDHPMDIEWAKDGFTNELYIVQARPETVESQKIASSFKNYRLKKRGKILSQGLAIGEAIAKGKVQVIKDVGQIKKFQKGSILVTEMTTPDWVPIMTEAAGIITDHGGRTSHAAIVSRELDVPAIVGTNIGTKVLKDGDLITLSCAEGDVGYVYEGFLPFEEKVVDLKKIPEVQTQIMMNSSSPSAAFRWWPLPCKGIGLARMEFIINNIIKIHPMALVHFNLVKDPLIRKKIIELTAPYADKKEYFIDLLARGIGRIAASQYPHPVIVRMSDFKTNEYANLIAGEYFEPHEENPMLGFRGASRYYNPKYKEGFALECAAIRMAREVIGLKNIIVMIPFCRTIEEAKKVLKVMAENGLKRGLQGLQVYVMCEIPSNVILAEEFADLFDGFSIGSNDLTQLTLGVDRDSEELSSLFDERNEAVKRLISHVIKVGKKKKCKVGICGQGPSDHMDFAEFLVQEGIDSLSLNPDSVIEVIKKIALIEKKKGKKIAKKNS
jgi:pyruvate, water dikinase